MRRFRSGYEAPDPERQERKNIRLETLHAIEAGGNDTVEIADLLWDDERAAFGSLERYTGR